MLGRFYVALLLLASPAAALEPDAQARLKALSAGQMATLVVHDTPKAPVEAVFIDAKGAERRLTDWPGEVVFVNIWATWCPPCLKEMPSIARLDQALGGDDFEVVAISTDRGDPRKPQEWLRENGAGNLKFYHDSRFRVPQAAAALGQPTSMILDRQGREIARLTGEAEWDSPEAQAVIRAVIEATAAP